MSDDLARRQYDASLSPAGHGRRARYTSGAAHHPSAARPDPGAPWSDGENEVRRERANYAWMHPSSRKRTSAQQQAQTRTDPFSSRSQATTGAHFDAFAGREAWARGRRGEWTGEGKTFGSGTSAFGAKAEEESRLINDSSTKRTSQVGHTLQRGSASSLYLHCQVVLMFVGAFILGSLLRGKKSMNEERSRR